MDGAFCVLGQNRRAETESAGGGASAGRLGGEVRASRLWPCGRHAHTDTLIRTPMRDSLVRVPMCDSLIRAPEHDTSNVYPCGTLSYRSLARHPCGTPSCGYPCAIPSYGRPARLSTYVRPRTIPPPFGVTGRGGARSGSPSALNLCPRPCLFPCRGYGRRTIRSDGSEARAAAARSRAGASAGQPA